MKYTVENGIHIVEIPVGDFKIVMNDSKKKTAAKKNFCNAGFFAGYDEGKVHFTLPVAHLVCDFDAKCEWTRHYCEERGKFKGNKFFFDSYNWSYQNNFNKKSISSLVVANGIANIQDIDKLPSNCDYVISGVPVMRAGNDVKFATYVKGQGWGGSSLYATYHIFVGTKAATSKFVYAMCMKTTTGNMITSAEAYKKLKALGFYDVIKLDGGGSTIFNINGSNKVCTSENRQINSIILFGDTQTVVAPTTSTTTKVESDNPYKTPSATLRKGSRGEGVKWLQFQLNELGYNCGKVDGIFGSGTQKSVINFQKDKDLDADGLVGPMTRNALK